MKVEGRRVAPMVVIFLELRMGSVTVPLASASKGTEKLLFDQNFKKYLEVLGGSTWRCDFFNN